MKLNNKTVAAILGMGVFAATSANLQAFALNAVQGRADAGISLNHRDAQGETVSIHEETVFVDFNNIGVVCCDGSLDDIDKNVLPNF